MTASGLSPRVTLDRTHAYVAFPIAAGSAGSPRPSRSSAPATGRAQVRWSPSRQGSTADEVSTPVEALTPPPAYHSSGTLSVWGLAPNQPPAPCPW